jgi:hypothetical protein
VLPWATVNDTVTGAANEAPDRSCIPVGPPGTVSDSVVMGTSGAVAANERVDALTFFQLPATGGSSVGMALDDESGAERRTVMGMSDGTFTAPDAGVVETTDKSLAGTADVVDGAPFAAAALFGPEWRRARIVPPAAMATMTTTREMTQSDRCRLDCRECLVCVFMAPAVQTWAATRCASKTLTMAWHPFAAESSHLLPPTDLRGQASPGRQGARR